MRNLINLFTLYKSSIEHNIDLLVIPFAVDLHGGGAGGAGGGAHGSPLSFF